MQGLDYVGVDDSELPEQETDNACTGLMFLNPTDTAKALLGKWRDTCQALNNNNQPAWNAVGHWSTSLICMQTCLQVATALQQQINRTWFAAISGH
jgi:hypothetical protein